MNAFAPPVRRDPWNRYLVLPPGAKKPVGYTRATTVAKALDDTSSLMDWSCRMTAIGLSARPDLLALVHATAADDKKALNDIVGRAKEAGGATARRDLGTALHSILEQSWTVDGYTAPDAYAADVAAVHQALRAAGLSVVAGMNERMVVHDEHRIAGTFDLLLRDGRGRLLCADVKTGADVRYGALGFAVQLAIYATAPCLYEQGAAHDGSEDVRTEMPDVDKDEAVIIHVEPGSGVCTLHRLDIATGREALALALAVRKMRTTKGLLAPLAVPPSPDNTKRADELNERIKRARAAHGAAWLYEAWPASVLMALLTGEHDTATLDAIEAALFPAFDEADEKIPAPAPQAKPAATAPAAPRPVPDEGGDAPADAMDRMRAECAGFDAERRAALSALLRLSGSQGGYHLNGDVGRLSVRKEAVMRACIALSSLAEDRQRAVLGFVWDSDEPLFPATPIGRVIAALTIDEARQVADLATVSLVFEVSDYTRVAA